MRTCLTFAAVLWMAAAAPAAEIETGELQKTFTVSHPGATPEAIATRFRYRDELPDRYDIAAHPFQAYVPDNYDGKESFGLIVAMDTRTAPNEELKQVLADRKLLWIAPDVGRVHELHAYGLAIDAVVNMAREYNIDKKRIVLLGNGQRAEWAGRLGVTGGDLFDKIIIAGRPDYYRDLNVPSTYHTGSGRYYYPKQYDPPRGKGFNRAKKASRFAFVVPRDMAEGGGHWCVLNQGFERDFRNVTLIQSEQPGAYRFDAQTLAAALDAVE